MKRKIVRIEKRNARDIEYREERIKNIELQKGRKGRNERLEGNRAEYQAKQRERKAGTVRTKDSWKDYL